MCTLNYQYNIYVAKAVASGTDRKIPSLEEVMSAFPNMPLNVDIKVDNDQLISKVSNDSYAVM